MTASPTATPEATGPTATPTPNANPLTAKVAAKCQRKIERAGAVFLAKQLKILDKCANGVLRCLQEKPTDGACLGKATVVCNDQMVGKLGALESKFRASVADACEGVGLTVADLLDPSALGFDGIAAECAARFGTPLADVAGVADCVLAQHECEAEQLFELQEPRAGELIALVRALGANFGAPVCLADHGMAGGTGMPKTLGKAVDKCAAQTKNAASKFAAAKLRGLERCVDVMFTCLVPKGGDPACLAKANDRCTKELAKIEVEAGKVGPSIDKRCGAGAIDFEVLRAATGANLDALAAECAALGVPTLDSIGDYETCLVRQHSCRTEELMRFEAPRADELLGLLSPPATLQSAFCQPPP